MDVKYARCIIIYRRTHAARDCYCPLCRNMSKHVETAALFTREKRTEGLPRLRRYDISHSWRTLHKNALKRCAN